MLISRWLYNVDSVKNRASPANTNTGAPTEAQATIDTGATLDVQTITNTQATSDTQSTESLSTTDPNPENIRWWTTTTPIPSTIEVKDFIGQGRKIQFCGLPQAVLDATGDANLCTSTPADLQRRAARVFERLHGRRPPAWYVIAVLSFLMVWTAIMSAFVVSFMAPIVGLGCRTLTYLLFGGFSSVSWVIQFWKQPSRWALRASYVSNALAVVALLVVIVFQVCFPFALPLSRPDD